MSAANLPTCQPCPPIPWAAQPVAGPPAVVVVSLPSCLLPSFSWPQGQPKWRKSFETYTSKVVPKKVSYGSYMAINRVSMIFHGLSAYQSILCWVAPLVASWNQNLHDRETAKRSPLEMYPSCWNLVQFLSHRKPQSLWAGGHFQHESSHTHFIPLGVTKEAVQSSEFQKQILDGWNMGLLGKRSSEKKNRCWKKAGSRRSTMIHHPHTISIGFVASIHMGGLWHCFTNITSSKTWPDWRWQCLLQLPSSN